MADLNARQILFLTALNALGKTLESAYLQSVTIAEDYAEEFANTQDNDLGQADNLESTYFFDAADVLSSVNQTVANFKNFWDGQPVPTREYGKDMRRVS